MSDDWAFILDCCNRGFCDDDFNGFMHWSDGESAFVPRPWAKGVHAGLVFNVDKLTAAHMVPKVGLNFCVCLIPPGALVISKN